MNWCVWRFHNVLKACHCHSFVVIYSDNVHNAQRCYWLHIKFAWLFQFPHPVALRILSKNYQCHWMMFLTDFIFFFGGSITILMIFYMYLYISFFKIWLFDHVLPSFACGTLKGTNYCYWITESVKWHSNLLTWLR